MHACVEQTVSLTIVDGLFMASHAPYDGSFFYRKSNEFLPDFLTLSSFFLNPQVVSSLHHGNLFDA